jgi:hypothetical protein
LIGTVVLELSGEMIETNRLWEAREASYSQTHTAFSMIVDSVDSQIAAIKEASYVKEEAERLSSIEAALGGLKLAGEAVIDGLEAPDDGSARVEAIAAWLVAVVDVQEAVEPEPSATTQPSTTIASAAIDVEEPSVGETSSLALDDSETSGSSASSNAGWLLGAFLAVGVAYWLGRRHESNS